jgi:hypothetical protein
MNEYAPEYTKKERIILVAKILIWVIPLYLFAEFWLFDRLAEYAANANCQQYGNVNGAHLMIYGTFVLIPLSFAGVLFLIEGRRSIKIIKLGQNPLPDEKVLRQTKYKYDAAARIQPIAIFSMIVFLIGVSVWGGFQAHKLTQSIKPCASNNSAQPDGRNDGT